MNFFDFIDQKVHEGIEAQLEVDAPEFLEKSKNRRVGLETLWKKNFDIFIRANNKEEWSLHEDMINYQIMKLNIIRCMSGFTNKTKEAKEIVNKMNKIQSRCKQAEMELENGR